MLETIYRYFYFISLYKKFQESFNISLIDAIVFGIKGAFLNLKLPKLTVTHNLITDEDIIDL